MKVDVDDWYVVRGGREGRRGEGRWREREGGGRGEGRWREREGRREGKRREEEGIITLHVGTATSRGRVMKKKMKRMQTDIEVVILLCD